MATTVDPDSRDRAVRDMRDALAGAARRRSGSRGGGRAAGERGGHGLRRAGRHGRRGALQLLPEWQRAGCGCAPAANWRRPDGRRGRVGGGLPGHAQPPLQRRRGQRPAAGRNGLLRRLRGGPAGAYAGRAATGCAPRTAWCCWTTRTATSATRSSTGC
ncbi:hypothetical protein NKH77_37765 [Streptomyces sp. M19]